MYRLEARIPPFWGDFMTVRPALEHLSLRAIRTFLVLLFLITLAACGTLEVGIERTPVLEPTDTAVIAASEPTRPATQTPARMSAGSGQLQAPATRSARQPTTAADGRVPDSCRIEGYERYIDPENRYCFAYPPEFSAGEFSPGQPGIFGPALDQSIEPLAAMLGIEADPVSTGSDLSELTDAFLSEYANLAAPPITRTSFELGGEPAELLEVVPGREGSRDVLVLHNSVLYRLLFMPSVRDFPQAESDVEALFDAVTTSFAFLD